MKNIDIRDNGHNSFRSGRKITKTLYFLVVFCLSTFIRSSVSVVTILVSIYFKMPSMKTNYFMRNRFSIPSNSKERVIMTHFI